MSVVGRRPESLTVGHVGQPFEGENLLHILCVNSREAELVELVRIASTMLSASQCGEVFWAQAKGAFFTAPPMVHYGGTPLGYAVAFSLQKAVRAMLTAGHTSNHASACRGLISLNDAEHFACSITGYLPIHVAVANSLTEMYEVLVHTPGMGHSGYHISADPKALTTIGSVSDYSMLGPLQLAGVLGHKKMVKYILRCRAHQQWSWGPV